MTKSDLDFTEILMCSTSLIYSYLFNISVLLYYFILFLSYYYLVCRWQQLSAPHTNNGQQCNLRERQQLLSDIFYWSQRWQWSLTISATKGRLCSFNLPHIEQAEHKLVVFFFGHCACNNFLSCSSADSDPVLSSKAEENIDKNVMKHLLICND